MAFNSLVLTNLTVFHSVHHHIHSQYAYKCFYGYPTMEGLSAFIFYSRMKVRKGSRVGKSVLCLVIPTPDQGDRWPFTLLEATYVLEHRLRFIVVTISFVSGPAVELAIATDSVGHVSGTKVF